MLDMLFIVIFYSTFKKISASYKKTTMVFFWNYNDKSYYSANKEIGKAREKDHLGDLSVDGRKILKYISGK
jgi:hypothetical protein